MLKFNKITIVTIFAIANFALVSFGSLSNFATVEEGRQLPAGLVHWKAGRFRLASDTPPLPRALAVLPILAWDPKADLTFSYEDYQKYQPEVDAELSRKFYEKNIKNYNFMLFLARLANFPWWLAGAWLIRRWSREVWGEGAGWLGLTLWCFAPNVLGLEMLATPDFAASVAVLAASYASWRWLDSSSWVTALVAASLLGMAALADFAALALFILLPAAWLAHDLPPRGGARPRAPHGWETRGVDLLLIVLFGFFVIHAGYFFSGVANRVRDFSFVSQSLGGEATTAAPHEYARSGNKFGATWLGALPVPVPTDYLYGIDLRRHAMERQRDAAWGADRARPQGRGHEAAWVAAATVPLGVWALIAWGTLLTLRVVRREGRTGAAFFLVFVFGVLSLLILSGSFIFRPKGYFVVFPLALIMIDGLGRPRGRRLSPESALAGSLTAWAVVAGLVAYPHDLNYLNELVGGSSSVAAQARYAVAADCGLDGSRLREWIDNHPADRAIGVACDSVADLRAFGIKPTWPPINPGPELARSPSYTRTIGPFPGVYAVDALNVSKPRWQYFLQFEPVQRLGLSTFIYRISSGGAEAVRRRLGFPPLPTELAAHGREGEYGFRHFVHHDPSGQDYNYAVFVPKDYAGDKDYPMILMLHGYGDRGFDGSRFLKVGLPRAVEARKEAFSFFVICPEGHEGNWAEGGDDARIVMELLSETQKRFRIDPKRVYLTGVSSGAAATWRFAARFPDRWAAIFPVATSECDPEQGPALKDVPVWCFHNYNDVTAPPNIPRRMIEAIEHAGGHPRYTEFVVLSDEEERTDPLIKKHNAWTKAYATEELYDWLLENRLP
jgi:predicted esterase